MINSMEHPRPAVAKRVYDRFQALAGRLISRPLGRLHIIWITQLRIGTGEL
jgi:hypothetical protein